MSAEENTSQASRLLDRGLQFIRTPWSNVQEVMEPPSLPPAPGESGPPAASAVGRGRPIPESIAQTASHRADGVSSTRSNGLPRTGTDDTGTSEDGKEKSRPKGSKVRAKDLSREELIDHIKYLQQRLARSQEKYKEKRAQAQEAFAARAALDDALFSVVGVRIEDISHPNGSLDQKRLERALARHRSSQEADRSAIRSSYEAQVRRMAGDLEREQSERERESVLWEQTLAEKDRRIQELENQLARDATAGPEEAQTPAESRPETSVQSTEQESASAASPAPNDETHDAGVDKPASPAARQDAATSIEEPDGTNLASSEREEYKTALLHARRRVVELEQELASHRSESQQRHGSPREDSTAETEAVYESQVRELQAKARRARQMVADRDAQVASLTEQVRSLEEEARVGKPTERWLLQYASVQAQRDHAVHRLEQQVDSLQEALSEEKHNVQLAREQEQLLKQEIRSLERSQTRSGVNLEYLKNVLVQFMGLPREAPARKSLLPVVCTLLQLDAEEKAVIDGRGEAPHIDRQNGTIRGANVTHVAAQLSTPSHPPPAVSVSSVTPTRSRMAETPATTPVVTPVPRPQGFFASLWSALTTPPTSRQPPVREEVAPEEDHVRDAEESKERDSGVGALRRPLVFEDEAGDSRGSPAVLDAPGHAGSGDGGQGETDDMGEKAHLSRPTPLAREVVDEEEDDEEGEFL